MKQITEDYVNFETAVLLKEKGFNGDCDYWYSEYGERCCSSSVISVECWCPSQSLALKWLREVHHVDIMVNVADHSTITMEQAYYSTRIYKERRLQSRMSPASHTYEEAVEAALLYVLKNLI